MSKIPVTILTGYLGSGKTTLLNHILTSNEGRKFAVIVNEIGKIGIDNQLIIRSEEDVIEMTNGCICCTFREDLISTLQDLSKKKIEGTYDFEGIIVETTGLANPGPIISSFFLDAEVSQVYRINGIVSVVDAYHFQKHLSKGDEVISQLAYADVIIINKVDLIDRSKEIELINQIRSINQAAIFHFTSDCVMDTSLLLNISTFSFEKKELILNEHHVHSEKRKDIQSFILECDNPLELEAVNEWLSAIVHELNEYLYRYKGILYIRGSEKRLVFQGVHGMFAAKFDRDWDEHEEKKSQLVFIGKHLNKEWFEETFQQLEL